MDDITALEYHIDEDIVMDNFDMEEPNYPIERSDRRKFLKMVIGSVLGSFALIPAVPSFLFGMPPGQGLTTVELPAESSLPDPLLTRIIDTIHPITEDEITRIILPEIIHIPDKLKGSGSRTRMSG